MAIDITGAIKDNKKLLLSILGVCILAIMTGIAAGKDGGFFGFWDLGNGGLGQSGTSILPTNVGNSAFVNNGNNNKYSSAPNMTIDKNADYQGIIVTNLGSITIDLYEKETPVTVNNFVFLANSGFYNGTSFHRVIKGYIIQGGDPLGTGYGGPGYSFGNEIIPNLTFEPFVVAMANSGPNTNGSQFFITTRTSDASSLDGSYTIFGRVIGGMTTVDKIESVSVGSNSSQQYLPDQPVIISSVQIVKN